MIAQLDTPRGPVIIRYTREEDAEAYRALRLEGLRLHPVAFTKDRERAEAQPLSFWQERMRRGAGSPTGVQVVAEADGQLVGMTGLFREESPKLRHAGLITNVYVRAEWRGNAIAEALIGACVAWATEQGMRLVRLGVAAVNAPALRCYLRCGFSIYGVEPDAVHWDGAFYDELLMYRRL